MAAAVLSAPRADDSVLATIGSYRLIPVLRKFRNQDMECSIYIAGIRRCEMMGIMRWIGGKDNGQDRTTRLASMIPKVN